MCPSVTWQWRTQPRPSSQLKCGQTPRQTGNSQDSEGTLSGMDPTQMGTPALGEGGGWMMLALFHTCRDFQVG